jgi:N-methylhydantoinase A
LKRVGIDVGGTFTDVVVLDEGSGATSWFKTSTDYDSPAEGVLRIVAAACGADDSMSQIKLGTTLGLNAVLTRSGAATGLLTTRGFRDVLEIRRTHRKRLFDLNETVPEPLVLRNRRVEITERVSTAGEVVTPLDEDEVRRAWRELRSQGVTAVAVVYLFAFENPVHEQRTKQIILEEGGAEVVLTSTEVLPVLREYERTSTTVVAAYVTPVVRGYLSDLEARLERHGYGEGRVSVMTNSGGAMAAEAASRAPVPTLMSGPAGGVAAAKWLAERAGITSLLTLDMGGTSCDVSGIVDGVPDERLDMEVGGIDVAYPTFDIHTIGAGGGSIAWIDSGGALRVGPQSAGSTPGPACYSRGGTSPTVTDANLVLRRYDARTLLGGSLTLDVAAARASIEEHIASRLGVSVERAAAGILRIVNAHMVNAVRTISVERGRDARQFALGAFGGGGPVHATDIARELHIPTVLIPPFPGCTSAFGAAISVSRQDILRSVARDVDELDVAHLQDQLESMAAEARAALAQEGHPDERMRTEVWFNYRYAGQAHDLAVSMSDGALDVARLAESVKDFHRLHEQLYGHSFQDVSVDLVTMRVAGFAVPDDPEMWWDWDRTGRDGLAPSREVYFEETDEFIETQVVGRVQIGAGRRLDGPAVVHAADSTTLIPPRWSAIAHPTGSLLITRDEDAR